MKEEFLFLLQNEENAFTAGSKIDVDHYLRMMEMSDKDIEFKVVAKFKKPFTLDFEASILEWYDKKEHSPEDNKQAILAIVNYLK